MNNRLEKIQNDILDIQKFLMNDTLGMHSDATLKAYIKNLETDINLTIREDRNESLTSTYDYINNIKNIIGRNTSYLINNSGIFNRDKTTRNSDGFINDVLTELIKISGIIDEYAIKDQEAKQDESAYKKDLALILNNTDRENPGLNTLIKLAIRIRAEEQFNELRRLFNLFGNWVIPILRNMQRNIDTSFYQINVSDKFETIINMIEDTKANMQHDNYDFGDMESQIRKISNRINDLMQFI